MMHAIVSYFFLSFPRSEEEEVQTKNVWMKGHTGYSTLCQMLPCSYRSRLRKYHPTLESACCCLTDPNEGGLALGQAYRERLGV